MNYPPKAISVLILVQCLFIGMGYALSRKMVNVMEKVESPLLLLNALPNSMEFVLKTGLWAWMIPLLWAACISLRSESHQGIPMAQSTDAKITVGLTLLVVCVWSYGAMQAVDAAFGYNGPLTVVNFTN
ncbi:hypothetical protein [Prosthecobacter fluviatilis]|uniref:Uncharacterized protein n=1 Tax=Prosthecobacter fluviatilis TaxID=445931 RepID=A0ABW0KP79_9BACT